MKTFLASMALSFASISIYLIFIATDSNTPYEQFCKNSYYSWLALGMAVVFATCYLVTIFGESNK